MGATAAWTGPGLLVEGPSLHSGLSCTTTENGPRRGVRMLAHSGGVLTGAEGGSRKVQGGLELFGGRVPPARTL